MPRLSCNRIWQWIILGSLCLGVIGAVAIRTRNWVAQQSGGEMQYEAANVESDLSAFLRSIRPVYPYSVIPGGVYSSRELRDSIVRDPIIASHYADFDVVHARLVRSTMATLSYVSYRKNNQIVWTRKPLRIPKGELLLSDGVSFARARCGNRFSSTPVGPAPDRGPDVELSIPDLEAPRSNSSLTASTVAPVDILPVAELRLVDPAMGSWHTSPENVYSPSGSGLDPIYLNPVVTTPIIGSNSVIQRSPAPPLNPIFPVSPAHQPTTTPIPEPSTLWQVASTLFIGFAMFVFRTWSRKVRFGTGRGPTTMDPI